MDDGAVIASAADPVVIVPPMATTRGLTVSTLWDEAPKGSREMDPEPRPPRIRIARNVVWSLQSRHALFG